MTVRKISGHRTKSTFAEEKLVAKIMFNDHIRNVCECAERKAKKERERQLWIQEKEQKQKHHCKTYSYTIGCVADDEPETVGQWNFATRYQYE